METILEKESMKIGQIVIAKHNDGAIYLVEVTEIRKNSIDGTYVHIGASRSLKESVKVSIEINALKYAGSFPFEDYIFDILCDVQSP